MKAVLTLLSKRLETCSSTILHPDLLKYQLLRTNYSVPTLLARKFPLPSSRRDKLLEGLDSLAIRYQYD